MAHAPQFAHLCSEHLLLTLTVSPFPSGSSPSGVSNPAADPVRTKTVNVYFSKLSRVQFSCFFFFRSLRRSHAAVSRYDMLIDLVREARPGQNSGSTLLKRFPQVQFHNNNGGRAESPTAWTVRGLMDAGTDLFENLYRADGVPQGCFVHNSKPPLAHLKGR